MLTLSNIAIPEVMQHFKNRGISTSFLVPTQTGLAKSIMDATGSIREFLKAQDVHIFENQSQGPENKRLVTTVLFSKGRSVKTKTSLYRPISKEGDTRIWIYKLKQFATPGDLLAIAESAGRLIVVNCSQSNMDELLHKDNQEFSEFFPIVEAGKSEAALELLSKLTEVSKRGFVPNMRAGDTGVGYTLESLLGIEANNSKKPDFKGIEIKSGRYRSGNGGQAALFSQVPDWKKSALKGSNQVLETRGKYSVKKERKQLFHEMSCVKPNSYHMQLEISENLSELHQIYVPPDNPVGKCGDVLWMMAKLQARLKEKHRETMWVSAETQGKRDSEEFWYRHVKHSRGIDLSALPILLESGSITVHYTIKKLTTGAAKDQGYLFKMASKYIPLLFETTDEYTLS